MTTIRVTKSFGFETGHALYGYDGLCKNVHGHSYKLHVTVVGRPIDDQNNVKNGMVIDFKDLKTIVKSEIVDVFDHATVFNKNTPMSIWQKRFPIVVIKYCWWTISPQVKRWLLILLIALLLVTQPYQAA